MLEAQLIFDVLVYGKHFIYTPWYIIGIKLYVHKIAT